MYLTIVRNSFIDRGMVSDKSDQTPQVTSLVLNYLKEKEISEPVLEKRIAYLEGCVKNFTCSAHGENNYLKNE